MSTSSTRRTAAGGLILGLGVLLLGANPAAAHVSADKSEVPAGGFTDITLTVPHGCEDSPTTRLDIEIPESILDVTPAVVPGWDATVATEPLDEPIEGEEGEITERESVVTYTAQPGNELPNGFRLSYTIGFQAPETVGETLYFKTIQVCTEGQTEWIEEWDGTGEEPEHPAPAVTVVEAEGDGHGGGSEEEATDEETTTTLATEQAASTSDDDSDSSDGLAIAGLVAGVLGLIVGGVALVTARKTASN